MFVLPPAIQDYEQHSSVHVVIRVCVAVVVTSCACFFCLQESKKHTPTHGSENDAHISMTVVDGGGLTSTLPEML
jgi:hypothetical protein